MKTLGIAATGMLAQQTNVDTIANNIANAGTTGYKTARASFQDLIYQAMQREGAPTGDGTARPVGVDIGLGVRAAGVTRLNTQGGLTQTDNQLDIAIDGAGYFTVTRPDGTNAYTRAGNLQLSAEGEIVTLEGYLLEPAMVVPENATSVEITDDGRVLAYTNDDVAPEELGQITLATFINDAGMKPIGNNLLLETAASGEPFVGNPGEEMIGVLRQGYLENSNVDPIKQMTDLITAQRTYEMGSKAMKAADEMMQTANQNPLMLITSKLRSLLLCAAAVLAATGVSAEGVAVHGADVSDLVEERILGEIGNDIPEDGQIDLRLPVGLPANGVRLEDFSFDARSGMFAARLIAEDSTSLGFRGQAIVTVPAMVPSRRIPAGTILGQEDLRLVMMALATIPSGALRAEADILGKETRRVLIEDRPVPDGSISEPRVVSRGDEVTISLSRGGLDLTAPGKALEDGARGDLVRVVNLSSNQTIKATIDGEGSVKVEN